MPSRPARSLATLTFVGLVAACQGAPGPEDDAVDGGDHAAELELFGPSGHDFRFVISAEQAEEMQTSGFDPGAEDQYELGGGTYADDLIVTDAESGAQTSLGKIQLKLIGQSSARPWNRIPNLRIDLDQFQPGLKLDGVEHLRFNNGQVGGIFREAIALRLWGALGYPVPRTSFAWVEAPAQWPDLRVPYTMVEVYKPGWCDHAMGGCENVWEAQGELPSLAGQCQFDECDDARLLEAAALIGETAAGPGFSEATAAYIDWDAYRSFQCLSWISGTGDDYTHNNNNLVVVERADGLLQLLPYSTDISAGQEWYPYVNLIGGSVLSVGCQNDPVCWAAMLERCDELLDAYDDLDVVAAVVDPAIAAVVDAGMEREGDQTRAEELRAWYGERSALLRADAVWEATPCLDDATCEERDDGKTSCQGVCSEPPPRCDVDPCPDGFWCDESFDCQPF